MSPLAEAIRTALEEKAVPAVVQDIVDAFESQGIHACLVAMRVGDPTPCVVNRIQQTDIAGAAFAGLGHRVGAWLSMQARPRGTRGPQQRPQQAQPPPKARGPRPRG